MTCLVYQVFSVIYLSQNYFIVAQNLSTWTYKCDSWRWRSFRWDWRWVGLRRRSRYISGARAWIELRIKWYWRTNHVDLLPPPSDSSRHFFGKDKIIKWNKSIPIQRVRQRSHNIVTRLPGSIGAARDAKSKTDL